MFPLIPLIIASLLRKYLTHQTLFLLSMLLDFGWHPSITSFTTNRFRQHHEMRRRRNPCNLVQIKCESDLHLITSTTNLTMSGLEVKSGITNRVWPINTVESRRTFPSKVKNLHNAVNNNNLVQICITSNRKPVIAFYTVLV